jgi:hypothetical protein
MGQTMRLFRALLGSILKAKISGAQRRGRRGYEGAPDVEMATLHSPGFAKATAGLCPHVLMSPVDWIGAALPEVLSRPQNGPTFYEPVAIDHPDRTVDRI